MPRCAGSTITLGYRTEPRSSSSTAATPSTAGVRSTSCTGTCGGPSPNDEAALALRMGPGRAVGVVEQLVGPLVVGELLGLGVPVEPGLRGQGDVGQQGEGGR